jgi:hypothetical protein
MTGADQPITAVAGFTPSPHESPWWKLVELTTEKIYLATKEIFCITSGTLD